MNRIESPTGKTPACRGRRPDPSKREAIIEAAGRLFTAQGYGVTMETIATEAGVSKQTIYNLFSTKELLFGAVVGTCSRVIFEAISNPADDAPLREVLMGLAGEFLRLMAGGRVPTVYRMMVSAMIDAGGYSELSQHFYDNGPRKGVGLFTAYLARQHELGRMRVPDPALSAESFFGMLNGHILIRNMLRLQEHWDEEFLRKKAAYCVEMFLRMHAVQDSPESLSA